MTTDDHLDMILAHCRERLAIAEKRTQGEWKYETEIFDGWGGDERGHYVTYGEGLNVCLEADEADATFIAACAGSSETGWKATIAAIEALRASMSEGSIHYHTGRNAIAAILAAYPIELLKP